MSERNDRGFTTVELLVVMAVAIAVMATAFRALNESLPRWRTRQAANDVAAALRSARTHAILKGGAAAMPFDAGNGEYLVYARTAPGTDRKEIYDGNLVRVAALPDGVTFVKPESGDPITVRRDGADDDTAEFSSRGLLQCPNLPSYVYVGNAAKSIYHRVVVDFNGATTLQRWEGGSWR